MSRLPAFAAGLTCSAKAVGAATSTGATQHSFTTPDREAATAAATPGAARITPTGVGAVRLGRTYASLRRRVATIAVRGGATARGVGIGATSAAVRKRFRAPSSIIAATRSSA